MSDRDPLVVAFEQAAAHAERHRFEDDIAAVAPLRDRLSAVIAAARAVVDGEVRAAARDEITHDMAVLRDALDAADGAM